MHKDVEEVLFTEEQIRQRVHEIGAQITEDYADCSSVNGKPDLVLVSVLRGAALFMGDLARQIDLPLEMDYMVVSSYGASTTSSGVVRILKDLSTDIEGRHVIIAEDVIDTGLTLSYLIDFLKDRKPASITVAAFLRKDVKGQADIPCKYMGFECPDKFVVGYGLDYAERYRNLPYIGVLKPEMYS
ncbi:MAG: hypoxanthine phosphoribosyltransferase [Eggerthellaceae bacterium]|nr:hypoxanthine phosphoribosyltransferase [Eggerthellaceae bacterium]